MPNLIRESQGVVVVGVAYGYPGQESNVDLAAVSFPFVTNTNLQILEILDKCTSHNLSQLRQDQQLAFGAVDSLFGSTKRSLRAQCISVHLNFLLTRRWVIQALRTSPLGD